MLRICIEKSSYVTVQKIISNIILRVPIFVSEVKLHAKQNFFYFSMIDVQFYVETLAAQLSTICSHIHFIALSRVCVEWEGI